MTRRRIRLLGAASSLTLAFALVSCDGRELVAPGVSPAGGTRAALTEPVPFASKALLPPENTTIQAGETVTIGEVPAKTWVVLEVSGSVSGTQNPACADRPPNYPCPPGPIVAPFGGADPYAPVTVTYTYEQFGSHTGAILLRGTGATTGVGLYRINEPSTLQGYVKVNQLTTWDPLHGVMLPSFINLTGGFTVAAQMVPAPFAVTESAPDASGTIHYEAAPQHGLEFHNPPLMGNIPPGDLLWRWYPGDNLPDEPDNSWPGVDVYECERKTVCDYRPAGPGRMQIRAYVERQTADVRSKRVAVCDAAPTLGASLPGDASYNTIIGDDYCLTLLPELTLACNLQNDSVSVQRGDRVDCRAEAKPQADGPITWEFAADSFPYHHPQPGATAHTGASWNGTMVLSGTVTARATIRSTPMEAKVHVRVTPRNWAGKEFPVSVTERPWTDAKTRPDSVRDLGKIVHRASFTVDGRWVPILEGPNSLLGYLVQMPVSYEGDVRVNRLALRDSSDFWLAQRTTLPELQNGQPIPCRRSDVVPFIPVVLTHEGVGLASNSHAYLYIQKAKLLFGPAVEPIVGTSAQDLQTRVVAVLSPAADSAELAGAKADSAGYRPNYCYFNYRYPE